MAKYDLSEKETRISPVLSRKEPDICKQERYSTYKHNIEARSRNHCCRGNATRVTHSEYMSVALGIQHAIRMRHFVKCGSPIFLHIIS